MAADLHASKWRNFVSWSVAGGVVVIVAVAAASWLVQGKTPDTLFASGMDPRVVLALLGSMAVIGLSSRNKPFEWRSFRNFVALSAVTYAIAILVITGFRPLASGGTFGTMGVSEWAAAGAGLMLLFFSALICLIPAFAQRGWTTLDADQIETLNERGRATVLSGITVGAMGLMLLLLALGGPGSVVPPAAALIGLVVLLAVTTLLTITMWRLMDELDRTLSYETGNLAFYLIVMLGGAWAVLAHLGFVAGPAPIDWVTLFTVLMFVASFIALGRRRLLTR